MLGNATSIKPEPDEMQKGSQDGKGLSKVKDYSQIKVYWKGLKKKSHFTKRRMRGKTERDRFRNSSTRQVRILGKPRGGNY